MVKSFCGGVCLYFLSNLPLLGHSYFEGITDIETNTRKNRIEVVHRYTTHDLEILLSSKYHQKILADQANYKQYLQQYLSQKFSLSIGHKPINLYWVGIENGITETVIYQMSSGLFPLLGVRVHNEILTDFFPEQLNRVNFKDSEVTGTLIFNQDTKQAVIISSQTQ